MKTIVTEPHPSVGKEDPPRKKVIPKDPRWSKKNGDSITIQTLGYGVDDYLGGSMQKGKITMFEGGWFSSFFIHQAWEVKQALLKRQLDLCYSFSLS